jgi:hypothetical protein
MIYLVEISIGEPPIAPRWLLSKKLGEESFLAAMAGRAIDGS